MMTNDQIHTPVNAFSAKYLLVILRISIFLDPPVTTGQDQSTFCSRRVSILFWISFSACAPHSTSLTEIIPIFRFRSPPWAAALSGIS